MELTALIKLLDTWSEWKRLKALPAEIEALKQRIAALERAPAGPKTDECPRCHGLEYRLVESAPDPVFGRLGVNQHLYRCSTCQYERRVSDQRQN